jgi:hypothetical protein
MYPAGNSRCLSVDAGFMGFSVSFDRTVLITLPNGLPASASSFPCGADAGQAMVQYVPPNEYSLLSCQSGTVDFAVSGGVRSLVAHHAVVSGTVEDGGVEQHVVDANLVCQ